MFFAFCRYLKKAQKVLIRNHLGFCGFENTMHVEIFQDYLIQQIVSQNLKYHLVTKLGTIKRETDFILVMKMSGQFFFKNHLCNEHMIFQKFYFEMLAFVTAKKL